MKDTKEKILNITQSLFIQKGYNATSIQDIITLAGISKGGFYHHFSSKETLLIGLTDRITVQQNQKLTPLIHQPDKNALQKMNELFAQANKMKTDQPKMMKTIFEVLFNRNNLPYRKAVEEASVRVTVKLLEVLIAEGQKEGIFLPGLPHYLADIIARQGIILAGQFGEIVISGERDNEKNVKNLIDTYELAIERILGLKGNDHVHIIDKKTVISFIRNLQKEDQK